MKNLKFIKKLTWDDVFEVGVGTKRIWSIGRNTGAQKDLSLGQTGEWKKLRASNANKMNWELYEVKNVLKTIPAFKGGPFTSWLKYFYAPLGKDAKNLPTFAELAASPAVANHYYNLDLIKTFPKNTILTAVKTLQGIVVIEGMHRACAIALSIAQGRPVKTKVKVALAKIKGNIKINRK